MRLNGSFVHYVVQDGHESTHGQCRPAAVVQDWGQTTEALFEGSTVNLTVFRDGENDLPGRTPVQWETSRPYSTRHEFGSWHFSGDCGAPGSVPEPAPLLVGVVAEEARPSDVH